MDYQNIRDFAVLDFLYQFLSKEYHVIRGDLDELSRDGFDTMYMGEGSGLRKFINNYRKTGKKAEPEEMEAAWRSISGMEGTLIALLQDREQLAKVA
ncbi:MAG TPA: hypothetical protein VHA12_00460 [Candidatus Nanoarchaeia archaeon]|nr:hypothetical protein [Candidatus Nanoarchaeia archaeon]